MAESGGTAGSGGTGEEVICDAEPSAGDDFSGRRPNHLLPPGVRAPDVLGDSAPTAGMSTDSFRNGARMVVLPDSVGRTDIGDGVAAGNRGVPSGVGVLNPECSPVPLVTSSPGGRSGLFTPLLADADEVFGNGGSPNADRSISTA